MPGDDNRYGEPGDGGEQNGLHDADNIVCLHLSMSLFVRDRSAARFVTVQRTVQRRVTRQGRNDPDPEGPRHSRCRTRHTITPTLETMETNTTNAGARRRVDLQAALLHLPLPPPPPPP